MVLLLAMGDAGIAVLVDAVMDGVGAAPAGAGTGNNTDSGTGGRTGDVLVLLVGTGCATSTLSLLLDDIDGNSGASAGSKQYCVSVDESVTPAHPGMTTAVSPELR
jgi:hypothetical protein